MRRVSNIFGIVGILLIQAATLPTIYKLIVGINTNLPPLDMVIMMEMGLACFLFNSVYKRDWLYTISNSVGLIIETILLVLIIIK